MANDFGVSAAFIDTELSSFISSGKLTCKIDKVAGVVESNEADARSQVYVEIIKQGDLLLNKMQKLSGAIDITWHQHVMGSGSSAEKYKGAQLEVPAAHVVTVKPRQSLDISAIRSDEATASGLSFQEEEMLRDPNICTAQ
eukprot:g30208.t1